MVNWKNVRLIFFRELGDQLRDRRTLFMIIVFPLLLYPGLGIGMLELRLLSFEQPQTVVLWGDQYLPGGDYPPLVQDGRFAKSLFRRPDDASNLHVLTESALKQETDDSEVNDQHLELYQTVRKINAAVAERDKLSAELAEQPADSEQAEQLRARIGELDRQAGRLFNQAKIEGLVIIPRGFARELKEVNRQIAERVDSASAEADYPRPQIIHNSADEKSHITFIRLEGVLDRWEDEILEHRLQSAHLPTNLHRPVQAQSTDLALEEQLNSKIWSQLFPALLVIMSLTGAFYPAIDLGAGEKERGTMETMLICPASRPEIVLGKFLTVMTFSVTTVLLNLISMGLTGLYMASMMDARNLAKMPAPAFPSLVDIGWIILLLIPLAAMFSSLCLALATFARSSKEGQYYLTPLLMATLGMTMFCVFSGFELTEHQMFSVIPVCGVALLLKGLLMSSLSSGPLYVYAIPVLGSTLFYSFLALYWAIEQFKSEDVLFREAERFDLKLWIRHLLRDKEATPSFSEAVICFVLIMMLQFASISASAGADSSAEWMIRALFITQIAVIASPALFMGVMLTTSLVETFKIKWPSWGMLGTAALLAAALHPLSLEWMYQLAPFFPELPASMQEPIQRLMSSKVSWWYLLSAMALAPAICEELAFRGFILSGLRRTGRTWLAIGLSSLAFGFMHMIPQQVFNATILGLVLGMIAVRSNSLLPCCLFHLIYNALAVVNQRQGQQLQELLGNTALIRSEGGQLLYGWPVLLVAGLVAVTLLWKLVKGTLPWNSARQQPMSKPLITTGAGGN